MISALASHLHTALVHMCEAPEGPSWKPRYLPQVFIAMFAHSDTRRGSQKRISSMREGLKGLPNRTITHLGAFKTIPEIDLSNRKAGAKVLRCAMEGTIAQTSSAIALNMNPIITKTST
jgi:hypothetical protein